MVLQFPSEASMIVLKIFCGMEERFFFIKRQHAFNTVCSGGNYNREIHSITFIKTIL